MHHCLWWGLPQIYCWGTTSVYVVKERVEHYSYLEIYLAVNSEWQFYMQLLHKPALWLFAWKSVFEPFMCRCLDRVQKGKRIYTLTLIILGFLCTIKRGSLQLSTLNLCVRLRRVTHHVSQLAFHWKPTVSRIWDYFGRGFCNHLHFLMKSLLRLSGPFLLRLSRHSSV